MTSWFALLLCCIHTAGAFMPGVGIGKWGLSESSTSTATATRLNMVFDFFQKRTAEGIKQLERLTDQASKGNLALGLTELAVYTQQSNIAFAAGLEKSRNQLLQNIDSLLSGNPDEMLEELQDVLLMADLGMSTAEDVVAEVKSLQQDSSKKLNKKDLLSILRGKLIESLQQEGMDGAVQFSQNQMPTVLFVMGANGMGKTTTIGKLAHRLRTEGNQTVLMAACDTFRAGAVDQLVQWADRAEAECFVPSEVCKTPSAVLYGALDKAITENYDTILVDTSGRLSNNDALTAELAKMKRVIQKRMHIEKDEEGSPILNTKVPHETLLVLDAAQGRMALDSAKVWDKEIGLSGLILTKLDGSARGGSVVAISKELKLPVKLIGVGEGIDDLRDFEPERFVDSLLGVGDAGGSTTAEDGALMASRLNDMRKARDKRAEDKMASKSLPDIQPPTQVMGDATSEFPLQQVDIPFEETAVPAGLGHGPYRTQRKRGKNKKKKRGRR